MINIVHLGKYYFPDAGGIESVTISLAGGAVASGHSVSVICFERTPANSDEVIDGVHVIRAPITTMIASQPLGIKYFRQCLKYGKNADVIHLHVPNMLGALCALFIGKKPRLLVHWHSDVINKGVLGKILRPLETALLRRADCIVATSLVYADASETLAPFKNKITVVPIGVQDAKYEGNGLELPHLLEKEIDNRKIVLAVGRLVPYKGFNVLIEAAQQLPKDSVAVIVGGGPLQEGLQKAIEDNDVKDRVVLAGRLSDAALHTLFKRATLYCLPSTYRADLFVDDLDRHGVAAQWEGPGFARAVAHDQVIGLPRLCVQLSDTLATGEGFEAEFVRARWDEESLVGAARQADQVLAVVDDVLVAWKQCGAADI